MDSSRSVTLPPQLIVVLASFRRRSRSKEERRLSIAFAASVAAHAAALFGIAAHEVVRQPSSALGWGPAVLEAVLMQPATQPDVAPPEVITVQSHEESNAPASATPATAQPPGSVSPMQAGPVLGPAAAPGMADPPLSVTVGAIIEPATFGLRYANALKAKFPEPVMRPPQLRSSLVLSYPRAAIETRTQARIAAFLTIDEQGEIVDAELVPDEPLFGPGIHDALRQAHFVPADTDNRPVRYWAILEFAFWIEDAREQVSALAPTRAHAAVALPAGRRQ
jgi:hypothetical protein